MTVKLMSTWPLIPQSVTFYYLMTFRSKTHIFIDLGSERKEDYSLGDSLLDVSLMKKMAL